MVISPIVGTLRQQASRRVRLQIGSPSCTAYLQLSGRTAVPNHAITPAGLRACRPHSNETSIAESTPKRKNTRSPAVQRSLRRVAVEAQRSSGDSPRLPPGAADRKHGPPGYKSVQAVCVAEEFNMEMVVRILRSQGYPIDPHGTGFLDEQVVHTRSADGGEVFVFPSGTVVSWALPEDEAVKLASETLISAAMNPHVADLEVEHLEFQEDASKETSSIRGDTITLGTKKASMPGADHASGPKSTTLAQIAFSSGLARSTKLAVLETALAKYLDSTKPIPPLMANGSRLPFNQKFILQKTGALLELRAQLNHYSELTDSLPDLFWDSRHELGLEGYYDQVGRALDVGVRIKSLNAKMDYAHEIVSVLRETLTQSHSTTLEWVIIVLIAVEVGFELKREWKERQKARAE